MDACGSALVAPHLRAATLSVRAEDATFDNAAFVARLPSLERLRVEGETMLPDGLELPKLRSLSNLALKTLSPPAALFLGCALASSGGEHVVRMSNGNTIVALRPVSERAELDLAVASAADLAVLLGALSHNRGLRKLGLPLGRWWQNPYHWTHGANRGLQKTAHNLPALLTELGRALHWPPPPTVPPGSPDREREKDTLELDAFSQFAGDG